LLEDGPLSGWLRVDGNGVINRDAEAGTLLFVDVNKLDGRGNNAGGGGDKGISADEGRGGTGGGFM
jgi:hypothetical protein